MDLATELRLLQKEIIRIKTAQPTTSDSALLYKQTFNPGIFVSTTTYRKWKITCIAGASLDRAIFSPSLQPGVSMQFVALDYSPLRDFSYDIYWMQYGMTSDMISGRDDTRVFAPQSVTIYSNVPFEISAVEV